MGDGIASLCKFDALRSFISMILACAHIILRRWRANFTTVLVPRTQNRKLMTNSKEQLAILSGSSKASIVCRMRQRPKQVWDAASPIYFDVHSTIVISEEISQLIAPFNDIVTTLLPLKD